MSKDYMKSGEIRQGDSLHFDGKGFYTKTAKPKKRLAQRLMSALRLHGHSQNATTHPKRKANT